jgi:hypothetical protein
MLVLVLTTTGRLDCKRRVPMTRVVDCRLGPHPASVGTRVIRVLERCTVLASLVLFAAST